MVSELVTFVGIDLLWQLLAFKKDTQNVSLVLVILIMTDINDDGNDDDEEYEGNADAYRS